MLAIKLASDGVLGGELPLAAACFFAEPDDYWPSPQPGWLMTCICLLGGGPGGRPQPCFRVAAVAVLAVAAVASVVACRMPGQCWLLSLVLPGEGGGAAAMPFHFLLAASVTRCNGLRVSSVTTSRGVV